MMQPLTITIPASLVPSMKSAIHMLKDRLAKAKCDHEAVSCCVRCNTVSLAYVIGEAIGRAESTSSVPVVSVSCAQPNLAPCDCAEKTPSYPVFRSNPHLPGCPHYREGQQ